MSRIGVGIVGLTDARGWAATAHVPALAALGDFKLTALSTTRAESSRAAAAAFGVPHAFTHHEGLVRCPAVDLVVVAVKVPHHREIVTAAIEAGKNVLCEWPLGRDAAEAEALAALAQARGVRAFIGLQARSSPAFAHLRTLVSSGFVGTLTALTATGTGNAWGARIDAASAYTADARNGATLLTIPVAHLVDALASIAGEVVELCATLETSRASVEVSGTGTSVPLTAPDQVALLARLASGATLTLSYRGGPSAGDGLAVALNGSDGELRVTGRHGHAQIVDLAIAGASGDGPMASLPIPESCYGTPIRSGPAVNVAETYLRIARDLREGTATAPTFVDALRRHRFVEAVERSAAEGAWVAPRLTADPLETPQAA